MIKTLLQRIYQGQQFIKDDTTATLNKNFRGFPILKNELCNGCEKCIKICPTGAILLNPLKIDMGKCTFCGECKNICPSNAIEFSNFHKLTASNRESLIIDSNITAKEFHETAIKSKKEIQRIFGKSLKLRQVSAGGCGGCELELNACSNVNFDMGRYGIDFVASPRHADGIVITGPITENMAEALEECFHAIPNPKIVILAGACAISGGVFQKSKDLNRIFLEKYPVDLYIPGCPVHPLTFINGILEFIQTK